MIQYLKNIFGKNDNKAPETKEVFTPKQLADFREAKQLNFQDKEVKERFLKSYGNSKFANLMCNDTVKPIIKPKDK